MLKKVNLVLQVEEFVLYLNKDVYKFVRIQKKVWKGVLRIFNISIWGGGSWRSIVEGASERMGDICFLFYIFLYDLNIL